MSNSYGSGISLHGTGIPMNNSLGEPELNPAGFFRIPHGAGCDANGNLHALADNRRHGACYIATGDKLGPSGPRTHTACPIY